MRLPIKITKKIEQQNGYKVRGAGDVLKYGITKILDKLPLSEKQRIKINECGGCKARQDFANKVLPFN